ncbi:hypothetical protein EX30DRAFT_337871 [Ascodesmis nigricans]|uniref:Uncharacterized protein n=1 Tax=Ascodesmis nigricans TaxID=341454 RepID=A0A4S2N8K0_9PEZI|nr:hypothetical protein EX30DRAFT_337871 [Ascodesmis nigricans]
MPPIRTTPRTHRTFPITTTTGTTTTNSHRTRHTTTNSSSDPCPRPLLRRNRHAFPLTIPLEPSALYSLPLIHANIITDLHSVQRLWLVYGPSSRPVKPAMMNVDDLSLAHQFIMECSQREKRARAELCRIARQARDNVNDDYDCTLLLGLGNATLSDVLKALWALEKELTKALLWLLGLGKWEEDLRGWRTSDEEDSQVESDVTYGWHLSELRKNGGKRVD